MLLLAPLALALLQARPATSEDLGVLLLEVRELRQQVFLLDAALRKRDELAAEMGRRVGTMSEELRALREASPAALAAPFLAGPPAATDLVGIAKGAVLAPRIEVDASRRHDSVFLRLKRVEERGLKTVAEVELGRDEASLDLPIDVNGAVYVVDWSTSDGYTYNLNLRDGAGGDAPGGAPAATVQVKALQAQGRFAFVGYRVD
jgi:hypothetical protein